MRQAICILQGLLIVSPSSLGGGTTIPANDRAVRWVGRVHPAAQRAVAFDWEGVSATVTLVGFTWITVAISDQCQGTGVGGGSRWGVTMTPVDLSIASRAHRFLTFYTGSRVREYYMFNLPGGQCDMGPTHKPIGTTSFTLTRLTESRLSGCTPTHNLSVLAFSSDGRFVTPAFEQPVRRIEFVGDSITAGDMDDGGEGAGGAPDKSCVNSAFNDDITYSSGAILCSQQRGFGADCMYTAWGGITLGVGSTWGMSDLYPYTFSSSGRGHEYLPWNFSAFPANAVVINLGTNRGWKPDRTAWVKAYVAFASDIVKKYYQNPALVLFLAYGPMTTDYAALVSDVIRNLVVSGVRAFPLDLTLPHAMRGCYGHPSHEDNVEIAAKARPQIARVLGWN